MNPCHDFADTVVAKMCPRRRFQQESQSDHIFGYQSDIVCALIDIFRYFY